MTRFEQVQQILEDAVSGDTIAAHGDFWRNKTRDQFVALKVFGKQLLVIGNSNDSNLIKALRGQSPFDGSSFPRMPVGYDPVPEETIQIIQRWIDDHCPDTPLPAGSDTAT
jgi:hypothetical protein